MYEFFYYLHILTVVVSGALFVVRGTWMIQESPLLQAKPVKILPHVNDTLLIAAAIGLMVVTSQYPVTHHWLTVKVVLLIVYIGLGVMALRRGKTKSQRIIYFVLALLTFLFMVSVALTHEPLGVLSQFT
ncbi:MAG: SirB2 family protein [Pseudomonadales bacterium]|nr:SirB2 family protein [Pseudomonadales bacterium]MBO6596953.1 SirB2 family protein [Pseudomonadales bacterium]MBO6658207.1 SirB2 family protein [Pseudomonadales bacterium]MBO6703596.1 SirB2 family protein [Pseudomonadales bacterium]MBO6823058.1 SirB2 family protein [Pseudomonadales bacterium]